MTIEIPGPHVRSTHDGHVHRYVLVNSDGAEVSDPLYIHHSKTDGYWLVTGHPDDKRMPDDWRAWDILPVQYRDAVDIVAGVFNQWTKQIGTPHE